MSELLKALRKARRDAVKRKDIPESIKKTYISFVDDTIKFFFGNENKKRRAR